MKFRYLIAGWSPRGYLHLWSPVQFNMDTFPMSYCFVIKGNTFPQSFPNHLLLLNFSTCNSSCETFSAVTWGDRTLGGAFLNTGNQDMVLLPEMSLSGEVKTCGVSKFRPHKELDSNQINFWMPVYFRILLTHPHVKILSDFVVLLELNGHPSYPCQMATCYEVMHDTARAQSPKSISTLVPGRFWQCSYWYLCDFYLLGVIRCFRIL